MIERQPGSFSIHYGRPVAPELGIWCVYFVVMREADCPWNVYSTLRNVYTTFCSYRENEVSILRGSVALKLACKDDRFLHGDVCMYLWLLNRGWYVNIAAAQCWYAQSQESISLLVILYRRPWSPRIDWKRTIREFEINSIVPEQRLPMFISNYYGTYEFRVLELCTSLHRLLWALLGGYCMHWALWSRFQVAALPERFTCIFKTRI